jgi:hypothetical protein
MQRRVTRRYVGQSLVAGATGILAAHVSATDLVAQTRPVRRAQLIQTTWHFAEGRTTPGWDEYLTLANPGPGNANVTITYYLTTWNSSAQRFDLSTVTKSLAVGAGRKTISVHYYSAVDPDPIRRLGLGRGWPLVSTKIQSDRGIVVERPMYFEYGPGIDGGHVALGADQPRTEWYFAEGYTGAGFDMYLTIFNPSGNASAVRITYYLNNGTTTTRDFTLDAGKSVRTAVHNGQNSNPNDQNYNPGGFGRNQEISTKVQSMNGVGIVAERAIYFSYGPGWNGGDIAMGAARPEQTWYFAEGFTGTNFNEFLTIQNPNPGSANITITYNIEGQGAIANNLTVLGNSRTTVVVHQPTPPGVGPGKSVSAVVSTTHLGGIVVERPMYFNYGFGGWHGGHVVIGATSPRMAWYFAEGWTGDGFDEYLTIQNPNSQAAQVRITYIFANGNTQEKFVTALANQRRTVTVHEHAEGVGRNQAVSAIVESLTAGVSIVVERPMYHRYIGGDVTGVIDATGGHVTLGYPI